ncbi:unnamed protein product, partial [Symbiodinium sp. KB8]
MPLPPPSDPLLLTVSLYYEGEKRVEDEDQDILNLVNPKDYALSSRETTVLISFRLEKVCALCHCTYTAAMPHLHSPLSLQVSRRKDGQKFMVLVEPQYPDRYRPGIRGVFTNPVTVMSKRKTGERQVSRRSRTMSIDSPSPDALKPMQDQLKCMMDMLTNINAQVSTLVKRVDHLDATTEELKAMAHASVNGLADDNLSSFRLTFEQGGVSQAALVRGSSDSFIASANGAVSVLSGYGGDTPTTEALAALPQPNIRRSDSGNSTGYPRARFGSMPAEFSTSDQDLSRYDDII